MWVCICNTVADHEINAAIDAGAATRESVTSACGAGGDCGACHEMIEEMIDDRGGILHAGKLVRHRAA
jgi:bacterioferritin-associated ferredoxin